MDFDTSLLGLAFVLGAAIKLLEENLRRQYLMVALTDALNAEDSELAKQVFNTLAAKPFWYRLYLWIEATLSLHKFVIRLRQEVAELRARQRR